MIVRIKGTTWCDGNSLANPNGRFICRKLTARLNVGCFSYDQTAADAGLDYDFAMQADAPPKLHWARCVIHLIDQNTIANKNMLSQVESRMMEFCTRRDVPTAMHPSQTHTAPVGGVPTTGQTHRKPAETGKAGKKHPALRPDLTAFRHTLC